MRFLKPVLATAVVVVSGLLAFSWFTTVTEDDIYAFHEVEFDTNPILLSPGNVVALSPNGSVTEICDFNIAEVHFGPVEESIYYNQLRQEFPSFVDSIEKVKALVGVTSDAQLQTAALDASEYTGRVFKGRNAAITNLQSTAKEFENGDCEEKMAWHLSRGFKACTVTKVLNSIVLQEDGSIVPQTVAVSFAEYSNFVTPEKFDEFGIEYTNAAAAANGKRCEGSSHPWTTVVKRNLNVIQRVKISTSHI